MTLAASGEISLAGSTANRSIAVEIYGPTASAQQTSLNDTPVRSLAGVPTGAIVMPTNFYGKTYTVPTGTQAYTTAGTYSFVVPAGVTKISVVCVGRGTVGYYCCCCGSAGGYGGPLSYTNCIPTTPGETLTVYLSGAAGPYTCCIYGAFVKRSSTILISADTGNFFTQVGAVKYQGGIGGNAPGSLTRQGGAAGAAGFAGNGGPGGTWPGGAGAAGTGGGGGGVAASAPANAPGARLGGGGGVGIIVQGPNGAAASATSGGGGGSGGTAGSPSAPTPLSAGPGGNYGGAGGALVGPSVYRTGKTVGNPGGAAVRIIYGTGRSYPTAST
jgi:hypothetical protein